MISARFRQYLKLLSRPLAECVSPIIRALRDFWQSLESLGRSCIQSLTIRPPPSSNSESHPHLEHPLLSPRDSSSRSRPTARSLRATTSPSTDTVSLSLNDQCTLPPSSSRVYSQLCSFEIDRSSVQDDDGISVHTRWGSRELLLLTLPYNDRRMIRKSENVMMVLPPKNLLSGLFVGYM